MFKHLSCQCPFKRKFEVNANTIFLVFFSLEPVHLELPIHLCPLSLKFPYFQVFFGFCSSMDFMAHGFGRALQKIAFASSIRCRFAFIPSTLRTPSANTEIYFYRIFCFSCRIFCSNNNSAF